MIYDPDGQPMNLLLNKAYRAKREVDELLGICKGIIADGHVNKAEVEFLESWLKLNRECADSWPANVLCPRIAAMLADDVITGEEERELLELLIAATGGDASQLNAHSLTA